VAITIRDVAREAGVSTATVSRALRGLGNVDPVTKEHVRRVADRLDYVISPSASRLASGRTGTVAVLTPSISRWYFATLLAGVERVVQEADVDLLLHTVGDPLEPVPSLAERRMRSRVDGVLVLGLPPANPDVTGLVRRGFPVILVGTRLAGVSSVAIDDVEGARVATQHLVNLGHRRVGLIGGRLGQGPFLPEVDRLAGYRQVLRAANLCIEAPLQVPGNFTKAGGEAAMNTLLAQSEPPTAVFAMSDEMAFGAMRALRRHGLRAGPDLALVGFDGHDMADLMELTTVSQPVEDLGEQGARDLLALLADPTRECTDRTVSTSLHVRATTAPPR
jgi:LacI family repressor for deo operon, udp, cdd, tsx, nupC, and nupG